MLEALGVTVGVEAEAVAQVASEMTVAPEGL